MEQQFSDISQEEVVSTGRHSSGDVNPREIPDMNARLSALQDPSPTCSCAYGKPQTLTGGPLQCHCKAPGSQEANRPTKMLHSVVPYILDIPCPQLLKLLLHKYFIPRNFGKVWSK
jgi:hypothetical protein